MPIDEHLDPYEQFLLREYDNIAQAHHNMVNTISTFFRHYLLFLSIPTSAVGLLWGLSDKMPPSSLPPELKWAIFGVAEIVTVICFLVYCYILNLRFDALLYARTVNGIRRYFFHVPGRVPLAERQLPTLPISDKVPPYFEAGYFLFVVLAFGVIDAAYAIGGVYWLHYNFQLPHAWGVGWASTVSGVIIALHVLTYSLLAHYREKRYLGSKLILAVDIDGVLNDHRRHFCDVLKSRRNKQLSPDAIVKIPVHQCEGLGVSLEDEAAVFNAPEYWKEMPVNAVAVSALGRIRETIGCQIELFTRRPWPQLAGLAPDDLANARKAWGIGPGKAGDHSKIVQWTEEWLDKHHVPHDRLVVESDKYDTSRCVLCSESRYEAAALGNRRVFIEDDMGNARALIAEGCLAVFLLAQPYNKTDEELPTNLIRVADWHEICRRLRRGVWPA